MRGSKIAVWLATAALMLTAVVAGTAVAEHGGSHGPSNEQDQHCPDHRTSPKDEDPGGVNSLDVDGTAVWLHYSDDGTSVAFFADKAGTEKLTVDSCIKAGDQNSGHVIAHENRVTWTNNNGQPLQISYTVVYSIEDGETECSDGVDNDGGGKTDLDDPGCDGPDDDDETSECQDGVDNDGGGAIDFPDDPGCDDLEDDDETSECQDGVDNDGDGEIDFPDDPGCDDPEDDDETDSGCTPGTDSDGDGVDDCDDQCPDTPAGTPVGPDGCPVDPPGVTLTCRANLIAAALAGNALPNLFEANAPSEPCESEQTGLLVLLDPLLSPTGLTNDDHQIVLADPGGSIPGAITIDALWADTESEPGSANANSGALFLSVNDGSGDQIIVEAVTSDSTTTASDDVCFGTDAEAKVVRITIAGNEIPITGEHLVLIDPALFDVIELHLEDGDPDGTDEGPDDSGAQPVDLAALTGQATAALADSESGCS